MAIPLTWGDCKWVPRPCPHTTCRHNNGKVVYNGTNCTLELAEAGPLSERQIGKALGLNVRQVREALDVGMKRLQDALQNSEKCIGDE